MFGEALQKFEKFVFFEHIWCMKSFGRGPLSSLTGLEPLAEICSCSILTVDFRLTLYQIDIEYRIMVRSFRRERFACVKDQVSKHIVGIRSLEFATNTREREF